MDCMKKSFRKGAVLDGRYETLSYVHEGSFGMVFKARDLETGEIVAVKCLTKRSVVDDAHAEFAAEDYLEDSEELAIHKHLGSHPNIVNLLAAFETESHLYFVLEYCERGDLYEAIRAQQGPVETEHVRQLMLEVIDAVEYIHSKGVYHRDIKPENIFLTHDGQVKLGDFGLATTETCSYENAVGSDQYMAPEQSDSAGAGYSPAQADIWAIGVCLLNILFSKNPFSKPTIEDPFFRDFFADSRSLFESFGAMSEDTFEVIEHCVNLNPARRSLDHARQALFRVRSFSTYCEDSDDFLVGSPNAQATANREPLGTPSIQSPALDQGAWDHSSLWTKALQATPAQPIRNSRLSVVQGVGSYSEDLFAKSVESTDWCSADTVQSHSLASTVDSSMAPHGASAFALRLPEKHRSRFASNDSAVVGSLPINMAKPKDARSLDALFGRKDNGPKSWSDMFDEDLEEESELYKKLNALQQNNARTFSHKSKSDEATVKFDYGDDVASHRTESIHTEQVAAVSHMVEDKEDISDGLFMYEPPSPKKESSGQNQGPRYSPPPKRSPSPTMDKWSALGQRRRAFAESSDKQQTRQQPVKFRAPITTSNNITTTSTITSSGTLEFTRPRRNLGFGHSNFSFRTANVEHSTPSHHHANLSNFNRNRDPRAGPSRDAHAACPRTRRYDFGGLPRDGGLRGDCRDWNWRKESRQDLGKIEWVGGYLEARS